MDTLTQSSHVTQAAYSTGNVGTHMTVISGASSVHYTHSLKHSQPEHKIRLVNADGWVLPLTGVAQTDVLGDFQTTHTFFIADSLSTPIILECEFRTKHGLIIVFKNCTVSTSDPQGLQLNLQLTRTRFKPRNITTVDDELLKAILSIITHITMHQTSTCRTRT